MQLFSLRDNSFTIVHVAYIDGELNWVVKIRNILET